MGLLQSLTARKIVHITIFLFSLFLAPFQIKAAQDSSRWSAQDSIILPFSRDTAVSSVREEQAGNCGGSKRLKLKGPQEMVLFDVDASALKSRLISAARIHIRSDSPDKAPLGRVSVSSLASSWVEGDATGYKPEPNASCFIQAHYKERDWAYSGSSLMDVVLGRGHTIWKFADCTPPDPNGWQTCEVDPAVVAARIAGISNGFCLYDDIGSVWSFRDGNYNETIFPNRTFFSREAGEENIPYLEIQGSGRDDTPPASVDVVEVNTRNLPAGEAVVSWKTPADEGGGKTAGFHVEYEKEDGSTSQMPRYLIPLAGKPGDEVRLHIRDLRLHAGELLKLTVMAVDNAGNVSNPRVAGCRVSEGVSLPAVPVADVSPFPPSDVLPVLNGLKVAVLDLLDKVDPVTGQMIPEHNGGYRGGNHLYSAAKRLIRLQSARNETISFQLNLEGRADDIGVHFIFDDYPEIKTEVFEFSYVKAGDKHESSSKLLPDPLLALTGSISIPSSSRVKIANQQNLSLICEAYVPHKISPGTKRGKVVLASGAETLILEVELKVWDFTLPNKLSFVPEMNAYATVTPYKGYEYYRLAHEHRTCLNRLPYGWDGRPSFAPDPGRGRTFDWAQWDRKVGPLLDGSAFEDLPRQGEPVDVFYLPFSENWPVELYDHYRPSYWADEAFDEQYKDDLGGYIAAFAEHCDKKGWHETIFQFYLNNKIRYRKKNSKSSAPWIFDEPVDVKDFWALRWYGVLFKNSLADYRGKASFWYRGDISYSQFGRNILWGVADIEYLGGINAQKTRMKQDEQRLFGGGNFAEYGHINRITEPNTHAVLWCLSAWCKGAVGVLPWQTIGEERSWEFGDRNALFYPDKSGPKPSVRLKAFQRAQQDVEYLVLFSQTRDLPFWVTADWLQGELNGLSSEVLRESADDAGEARFAGISPAQLWEWRYRIGGMISSQAPEYRRALVQFEKKEWAPDRLPDIGYVPAASSVPPMAPDCVNFRPH
jgi:hypothetical protein